MAEATRKTAASKPAPGKPAPKDTSNTSMADKAAVEGDASQASTTPEGKGTAPAADVQEQRDAEGKGDGVDTAADAPADLSATIGGSTGRNTDEAAATAPVAGANPVLPAKADGPDAAQRAGLDTSTARAVDPHRGVTSDAEPDAVARPSERRSPASGPLSPPDKTQTFRATKQTKHGEDAGPREDETAAEPPEYVDADGNGVSYDDIFKDDGNTFVIVKQRTWRTFVFQNTVERGKTLAFREGTRVPRAKAEAVRVALTGRADGEV